MTAPNITWPGTIAEATKLQEQHRKYVQIKTLKKEPGIVAGVDAIFCEDTVFAAVCLIRFADMTLIEQTTSRETIRFPYVPGYLIFLEGPAIISALKKLKQQPDIILVDGHGLAHPRNIGSASHLGVLLDIPTIGCAKKRLVGDFREPDRRKGSWSELYFEKRIVGAVLRTRQDIAPVFVSPGHKINLNDALRITMGCIGKYRIPEPLRCADMLSKRMRDGYFKGIASLSRAGTTDAK